MTNKLKRTSKFLYALVFIILMVNCATEENQLDQNNNLGVIAAKNWFENNIDNYNDPILRYAKELQWQNAIVTAGENGEVIEIPFSLKDNIAVTNDKQNQLKAYHRLVLIKETDQVYVPFYLQIFTNDENYNNLDKKFNYYNIKDFNGFINVYEPESQVSSTEKYEHGIRIKPSVTAKNDVMMCTYLGWWYEDGTFEEISLVGCNGGSGSLSYRPPTYGGGGGGSSGGITAPTPAQIIDALTGKAKCIFEKLKNSSSGFENAIKKFDGEFTVSHLKLTINNNLDTNVYGITNPPVNYVTEVQFDNTKLGTLSDLGAATVFAHEIIHAEIFRKMLSAAQRGTLNSKTPQEQVALVNSLKDNFPGLYDYYEKRWKPTWNHEMMANHYRGTIADIIQQFDNNRLPRSAYEAVAWLGLGKLDTNVATIAWDNLSPEQKTATTKLINEHFYKGPSNCN